MKRTSDNVTLDGFRMTRAEALAILQADAGGAQGKEEERRAYRQRCVETRQYEVVYTVEAGSLEEAERKFREYDGVEEESDEFMSTIDSHPTGSAELADDFNGHHHPDH